jgi:hypothetical protein
MKKIVLPALLLCFVILTLVSCSKSSSNNPKTNAVSLLTGSRWTFVKFEYQLKDGTWVPDPDAADADKFTVGFNTNNTYSTNDLVDGDNEVGTWNFSSNNTVMSTVGGGDVGGYVYTVSTLTSSTLLLTINNYPSGGYYIDERLTFTH